MKKLLALVLALVMTLGLATVSSSAAYSDDADISYEEAVDVMSALGVFDGTDGAFNPKGTLTREQGAKIIAYMILGKSAADSLSTAAAPFSDVAADRWSAGSIAYCTSEGIIGGVGGNKFDPEGTLTGYAFAKMLLVALGYNPAQEGLTGNDWSINTAKLAINAGLKKGGLSGLTMGDGITREEACQMAFNTEKATLVEYANNTTVTAGDITFSSSSKATKVDATIANNVGPVYDGYIKTAANNDAYMQFCELYAGDLVLDDTGTGKDSFGRPSNTWWNAKTEVGTYADGADFTYTGKVTRGQLYSDLGKSNVDNFTAVGGNSLTVIVDGRTVGTYSQANANATANVPVYFDKNNSTAAGVNVAGIWGATGNGSKTEMFIDDNNDVTLVIINEYLVQASAAYNANTGKLDIIIPTGASNPKSFDGATNDTITNYVSMKLSSDDFDVTGVKKDDYLVVTAATANAGTSYEIKSIAPATNLTGNVTTFAGNKNVTIDGTQYSYAANIASGVTHGKAVTYTVGEQATVVLDADNNVVFVKDAVTNENWVYILEAAKSSGVGSTYVADAYFADGSNQAITLKSVGGLDTAAALSGAKGWYNYSVGSDGKYKLTNSQAANVVSTTTAGDTLVTNGAINVKTQKANASTTFIVKKSASTVEVYNGIAAVPTIKQKAVTTAATPVVDASWNKLSSGYMKLVFIDASVNATLTSATSDDSELVYLLGNSATGGYRDADNNLYYTYSAIVDGAETTLNIADVADQEVGSAFATANNTFELGRLFYDSKVNDDGYVNSLTYASGGFTKVKAATTTFGLNATVGAGANTVLATNTTEVTYSGGVLTFSVGATGAVNGVATSANIITDDNTKVYLAIYPSCSLTNGVGAGKLMSDAGNDYELYTTTAEGLKNTLNGYYVAGQYDVVYKSATSNVASEIYVSVVNAVEK